MENKKLSNIRGYPCPCCGYLTLSSSSAGTFEICPVCHWEDDDLQALNPNLKGGANKESLNEAKEKYLKIGASAEKFLDDVREPYDYEYPNNV